MSASLTAKVRRCQTCLGSNFTARHSTTSETTRTSCRGSYLSSAIRSAFVRLVGGASVADLVLRLQRRSTNFNFNFRLSSRITSPWMTCEVHKRRSLSCLYHSPFRWLGRTHLVKCDFKNFYGEELTTCTLQVLLYRHVNTMHIYFHTVS